MFAYRRTPVLGLIFGGLIAGAVALVFVEPGRPLTLFQIVLLAVASCLPGMGIAMLFDPKPRETKQKYLKINFYEDKHAREKL